MQSISGEERRKNMYDMRKNFAHRLSRLRVEKDVSSRDMSLSLGLSPAYINNIENLVSLPSMDSFFLICEYFDISPRDFFDFEKAPSLALIDLYRKEELLSQEQVKLVSALVDAIVAGNDAAGKGVKKAIK